MCMFLPYLIHPQGRDERNKWKRDNQITFENWGSGGQFYPCSTRLVSLCLVATTPGSHCNKILRIPLYSDSSMSCWQVLLPKAVHTEVCQAQKRPLCYFFWLPFLLLIPTDSHYAKHLFKDGTGFTYFSPPKKQDATLWIYVASSVCLHLRDNSTFVHRGRHVISGSSILLALCHL